MIRAYRQTMLAVAVMILVSGCVATHQSVPLPDQSVAIENPALARIYVLRPTSFACVIAMRIDDNGKTIGETGPNGYLCWEREPGAIEITGTAENTARLPITVDQGETYYIGQHIRFGFLFARNKLRLMDEEEGKAKLKKCKPPCVVPD